MTTIWRQWDSVSSTSGRQQLILRISGIADPLLVGDPHMVRDIMIRPKDRFDS